MHPRWQSKPSDNILDFINFMSQVAGKPVFERRVGASDEDIARFTELVKTRTGENDLRQLPKLYVGYLKEFGRTAYEDKHQLIFNDSGGETIDDLIKFYSRMATDSTQNKCSSEDKEERDKLEDVDDEDDEDDEDDDLIAADPPEEWLLIAKAGLLPEVRLRYLRLDDPNEEPQVIEVDPDDNAWTPRATSFRKFLYQKGYFHFRIHCPGLGSSSQSFKSSLVRRPHVLQIATEWGFEPHWFSDSHLDSMMERDDGWLLLAEHPRLRRDTGNYYLFPPPALAHPAVHEMVRQFEKACN